MFTPLPLPLRPALLLGLLCSCQAMADDLFDFVRSGKVKIHIDQRFPLAEVQAAHKALEARQTTGSTILTL